MQSIRQLLGIRPFKCLGGHKICNRMHGELPEAAFKVRSPEDAKDAFRTTRHEGLKKMGGRWVSEESSDVVASFGRRRWIVICVAELEPDYIRETTTYETRISSQPRRGP